MIPVFVAHQESPTRLFGILALKVIVGIIAGLLVDVALRMLHRTGDGHAHIHELRERAHCHRGRERFYRVRGPGRDCGRAR